MKQLLITTLAITALTFHAQAGFNVQNGRLLDDNGKVFVMRGINYPHAWFSGNTRDSLVDIAETGANCVRIVLGNGDRWTETTESDVASIIQHCKDNGLIAVLEVHDTTGYSEQSDSVPLSNAVAYWIGIQGALIGQEDFVIINIGNEPLGNKWPASEWVNVHTQAISDLRSAGFTHTLMVDAANWGQDWQQITLEHAPAVFAADPLANVVFSIHMYDVYDSFAKIDTYMSTFAANELPLVVGEFASDHGGNKNIDESSIMAQAEAYGIGYIGWSWSGNSRELSSLDIVRGFDPTDLTPWGNTLINGANGIASTSVRASVFDGRLPERRVHSEGDEEHQPE